MKRAALIVLFTVLVGGAIHVTGWGQSGSTPGDEYTFETSRRGFPPIEYPGLLNYQDAVRLLLRHEGSFHLPITRSFRERRLAPEADLWELDLPQALKLRVSRGGIEVVAKPANLRLALEETYNLVTLLRNELDEPVDLKLIAGLGEAGTTDRWKIRPGLNYASLNLRPIFVGPGEVRLKIFAGDDLPQQGSPPESRIQAEATIPAEVVQWGNLRIRTLEDGRPEVARVYVRASDGLSYAPSGDSRNSTLSRITWTHGDYYFYSRGEHLLRLPEGVATIEAVRGIEYGIIRRRVEIRAGETAEVSLDLERRSNLAAEHWYGGDVHIHANYNNHEFITPSDVWLQALGEDLNVTNLMVANSIDSHIHDEQYFEGRPNRLSDATHILNWGEEMRNRGLYGHMCLTGLRSLVKPLYTGFDGTPYPYDYPPNHVQALAATRQGAAVSYAHPGYRLTDDPRTMSAREAPVDLALGSIQAMDVVSNNNEDATTAFWYRLLNTGLKCAISAGSDSFTNRRHMWIPGGHRVYVHTGGPLDYREWVDNYKRGRSFATNGPIVRFTVNGELPGAELELKAGDRLDIEASATSFLPMEALEVVMNGNVVAEAGAGGDKLSVALSKEISIESGAWLAARVRGPFDRHVVNDTYLYAHTSPVYCQVDGKRAGLRDDGAFFVRWIDQLIDMARERGKYASEEQRREVIELFRKGRAYYEKVAAEGR